MAGTWGSSHPPVDTLLGVCVSGTPAAQARCGLGKGRRALCAPGGRGPTVLTEGPVRTGHVPKIACPGPARAGGACTWGPLVSHRPRGRGTEEATARRATGSGEKWGAAHGGAPQATSAVSAGPAGKAGQCPPHMVRRSRGWSQAWNWVGLHQGTRSKDRAAFWTGTAVRERCRHSVGYRRARGETGRWPSA